jgi:nucleolin
MVTRSNMDKSSGPKASPQGRWDAPDRPAGKEGPGSDFEVFVGNLSWSATEADLRQHFASCGTIVRVKVLMSPDGRSKGAAFVGFDNEASVEAALRLAGTDFLDRQLKVSKAGDKPVRRDAPPAAARGDSSVVFVGNVSYQCTEEDLRAFFAGCGPIKSVRVAMGEDGRPKGFAHVEFESATAAAQAVALSGRELVERQVRVDYAEQKGSSRGGRGGRGGSGGRGRRGGWGNPGQGAPSSAPKQGGWD